MGPSPSAARAPQDPSGAITLRGFVAARWGLIALFALFEIAGLMPQADPLAGWLPWVRDSRGFVVLVPWVAINLVAIAQARRSARVTRDLTGVHLLLDVLAVTALLSLSGGATNPLTTLYFVPITLATLVGPRWTWVVASAALVGFGALFFVPPTPGHGGHHGDHGQFAGHLRGMWLSFAASGVLITFFVHRIALALARQRDELLALRQAAARDRQLTALGTLAAGAAHELGTPLATIAVLADELRHLHGAELETAHRTVAHELERCRTILSHMAAPVVSIRELEAAPADWDPLALVEHVPEARDGTPVEIRIDPSAMKQPRRTFQPLEAVRQIVTELIANATQACDERGDGHGVSVELSTSETHLMVQVRDDGPGMTGEVLQSAFEPFFSGRPDGRGLGLYIARAHAEQLGGSIELVSKPGEGTTATLELPLVPAASTGSIRGGSP